jgi:hypothetical protein
MTELVNRFGLCVLSAYMLESDLNVCGSVGRLQLLYCVCVLGGGGGVVGVIDKFLVQLGALFNNSVYVVFFESVYVVGFVGFT